MKAGIILAVVFAAAALTASTTSLKDEAIKKSEATTETEQQRNERLFKLYVGYYKQTTLLRIVTRTKTAIFTCLSTTETMAACSGRRRRSLIEDTNLEVDGKFDETDQITLDGSKNDQKSLEEPVEVKDRSGKKVTMWTSVYSTLEVTTTIYNQGTTLTASAICNIVNGMTIGNSCFG